MGGNLGGMDASFAMSGIGSHRLCAETVTRRSLTWRTRSFTLGLEAVTIR